MLAARATRRNTGLIIAFISDPIRVRAIAIREIRPKNCNFNRRAKRHGPSVFDAWSRPSRFKRFNRSTF